MDLTQLANLGEFVGGLAVLATLVYLVIQVRQNTEQIRQATEVARGTAELESAKMNLTYFSEFFRDPKLNDVWERGYLDPTSLSPEESTQFSYITATWFHLAQGHYRQYRRGLLPAESWEPIARALAGVIRHDSIQVWWGNNLFSLAVDFREYVEQLGIEYADEAWVPVRASELFGK